MRRVAVISLLSVQVITGSLVLGACGSGSDDESPLVDLAARVRAAGDDRMLVAVDLDAVREVLELPDDADPLDGVGGDDAERRLSGTGFALPHLAQPQQTPMHDALDAGQVSAAASNVTVGDGSVTVVATSQSFDEIAEPLVASGYQRDGDVLTYVGDELVTDVAYSHVAGGDGMIALSSAPDPESGADIVEAALDELPDDGSDDPGVELLADLDSPAVAIAAASDGSDCVDVFGVADRFDDGEDGELVVAATDDASEVEIVAGADRQPIRGYELGDPEVDGALIHLPMQRVDVPDGGVTPSPVSLLTGGIAVGELWECS